MKVATSSSKLSLVEKSVIVAAWTDEELVALVAASESWALAELYDRYARFVFSLAVRMLNDRASAEDTVQEVFTKVWRGASKFRPEVGHFSSWLIGITCHHCIDELRRRRVRPMTCSSDDRRIQDLDSEDDPVIAAADSFEQARIRQALAQLTPEQRRVIELAYFDGLTQKEIAARCGLPLGSVKTRILLGMRKLRDLLR